MPSCQRCQSNHFSKNAPFWHSRKLPRLTLPKTPLKSRGPVRVIGVREVLNPDLKGFAKIAIFIDFGPVVEGLHHEAVPPATLDQIAPLVDLSVNVN